MITFSPVEVNELMTRSPRTITADTTIGDAVQMMRTLNIRHLPITNDEGGFVGLVSDTEFARRSVRLPSSESFEAQTASLAAPVSTIMDGGGVVIEANEDVEEAVDLMEENNMGALAVIDREGGVVGIVSYLDVMQRLAVLESPFLARSEPEVIALTRTPRSF
jgi:predicted transcriptional regulator